MPDQRRRARLERLLAAQPPLQLVPSTTDRTAAMAWMRPEVRAVGIEGASKLFNARRRRLGGWRHRESGAVGRGRAGTTHWPRGLSVISENKQSGHGLRRRSRRALTDDGDQFALRALGYQRAAVVDRAS
ncbi:hypothetical protein AB0F91_40110 [Amycolatopsis sp. NPDC023774]|uniref:hypothetical protein n=1 Tax=Amycolatopsis sp. NPDC023774 TaxID=3155015 RepID=UPI0033FC2D2A